jgi:DHA1 family multidrug resistance protein-like MFS transporter
MTMAATSRRSMLILSLSLVIVSLGFGMIIPILPFYIERMGAGGGEMGLLVAVGSFTELIFSPAWGRFSDRVGRKPVLMIGILGYAAFSVLFGLASELWMLLAARALSGLLSSAAMVAATAYVGDCTSAEDRGGGMGILGAMGGLGLILGPGFGGSLATISLLTPFLVAAGLSLGTLLLILLFLPESLPAEARREATGNVAVLQAGVLWRTLFSSIGILLFMAFLSSFGLANFEAIFGLYALEKFDFGPERVGMILSVVGLVSTIGKLFTGSLTRRWGDAAVIKACTYLTILLATGFFILSKTFLRPSIMALTSKEATVGQGAAMGLSNSFMSLGRIVGPIWAGIAFDLNFDYPYLSGSAILFVGFLISLGTILPARARVSIAPKRLAGS